MSSDPHAANLPEKRSLVDELLAERKAEAERENLEDGSATEPSAGGGQSSVGSAAGPAAAYPQELTP